MSTTRRYGEACGIPRALDRVGERWALMIVRELMLGPKRFTDLKAGLPHASPNVLSQRLREMEEAGILHRRKLPPPAASQVYELTDWGRELEGVLHALGRWGARAPIGAEEEECGMSPDSHILSLQTLFDPKLAGDFSVSLNLRLGEQAMRAEVADGQLEIERGEHSRPDATLTTDHATLLALAHRRLELADAVRAGDIAIDGDQRRVKRFFGLFTLPEPAAVAAEA